MNRIMLLLAVATIQGCGDNRGAQEKVINIHIAKDVSTNKTHQELQASLKLLYAACPGFGLYKDDIATWEFIGEGAPYSFMQQDYGWAGSYVEFHTTIPMTKESKVPAEFYAFGHICQYRVSSTGEVDIMKTPCASVCLGSVAPNQSHNHLIISGKNVIKW